MTDNINQNSINSTLWGVCNIFRGTVSADTYKDYILTMLFLKYLSDVWQDHYENYQKEYGDEPELIEAMLETERFILPMVEIKNSDGEVVDTFRANFNSLYERRHQAGNGARIDLVLHEIEEANGTKLKDSGKSVFQDISFNSDRLGEEKQKNDLLYALLDAFGAEELDFSPSRIGNVDVIGNAYEYLIKRFAAGGGQKAGEFYTPPEVSELMAILLDPKPNEMICDPTCGSGSLLMKCGNKVVTNHNSKAYELYGQEAIGSTWALAKMNMFLHGEDNHRLEWGDTLRNPKLLDSNGQLLRFDVIAANPPFSLKQWGDEVAKNDPFNRFERGVPPKSYGDYAFILHMVETLKPETGRMAVIAPHGVLFRAGAEGEIRKALLEENILDAVIGLPEKLFYGTGIPAAILIFRMDKKDDSVLFIDASREFKAGKNQNALSDENIAKIVETYQKREFVDKYAYLATFDEIKENDYNLNIPRYVDTFEEEEPIDLIAVRNERIALKAELEVLEEKMAGYLEELGFNTDKETQ